MAAKDHDEAPEVREDPRLSSLEDRLRKVHRAEKQRTAPVGQSDALTGKGASQGQRILSTLIGAPLGAAIVGWVADNWFGSSPIGLLVMLFLGFGAAITQVIKIANERP